MMSRRSLTSSPGPRRLLPLVRLRPVCSAIILYPRLTRSPDPSSAAITLAKLQQPVKKGFDAVNDDLKEVYSALGKYSKALDKVQYSALSTFPPNPNVTP